MLSGVAMQQPLRQAKRELRAFEPMPGLCCSRVSNNTPSHYTQLSCRRHCRVCSDCVDPETRPSTSILTIWRRYATTSAQRRQQQTRSNSNNPWTFIASRRILLSWIPQQYWPAGPQKKERYKPRYKESQAPNGRRPARAATAFAP
jgi:hypothetical protein